MRLPHLVRSLAHAFDTLQGRLLIGLVVTWTVIVGLILALAWPLGRALVIERSLVHLNYESELISRSLSEHISQRTEALQSLAEALTERGGSETPEPRALLEHNRSLLAWFDGLMVTDAAGRVLADLPEVPGRAGLETAATEYFQMVSHSPWPYLSQPFVGRASGQPLVLLLVPRHTEEGRFAGVVGGLIDLSQGRFFRSLNALRLGESGYVAIFTASGQPIFLPSRDRGAAQDLARLRPEDFELALDGWEGEVRHELAGEPLLVAYRQIWPAGWVVASIVPEEQVLAPFRGLLTRLMWIWFGVALALLVLMAWLVRRLLWPLQRLEREIVQLASGARRELTLTTPIHDLQQVAEAVNRLERERSTALADLRDRQAFLDAVLGSTPVGMFVTDLSGRPTYANPALLELLGLGETPTPRELIRHILPEERRGTLDMWCHAVRSGRDFMRQFRLRRRGGQQLWVEVHARDVTIDGVSLGFVGTVKDITENREREALQRWEAEHDPLTGLLNRRGFERRLEEALADFIKRGTPSALILFDLDRFKPINDQGGHALGDEMLRRVAQVVSWTVRQSDHVARQGGDEFAILLPSSTMGNAMQIAETLREVIAEVSVSQGDKAYSVTASIGLTVFQEGDESIEAVMARADAASYAAKARGRDAVEMA